MQNIKEPYIKKIYFKEAKIKYLTETFSLSNTRIARRRPGKDEFVTSKVQKGKIENKETKKQSSLQKNSESTKGDLTTTY